MKENLKRYYYDAEDSVFIAISTTKSLFVILFKLWNPIHI